VARREWITDTGLLRGRGIYGSLPAGDVFVAPVENSAEGMLVGDESLPGLRLTEPVWLVFEAGRVVSIEGDPGASHLGRAIQAGKSNPNGET
jgi:aminopeptidase